jgi:cobalamin biosynthesis protein CobD/CbiB
MSKFNLSIVLSFLAGLLFSFIGFVNMFWGDDPFYGLLIFTLSFLFYHPVIQWLLEKLSPKIVLIIKMVFALFILWSSLGVGELLSKIKIMRQHLPNPEMES